MTPARLASDPLWRCLCPSWTATSALPTASLISRPRSAATSRGSYRKCPLISTYPSITSRSIQTQGRSWSDALVPRRVSKKVESIVRPAPPQSAPSEENDGSASSSVDSAPATAARSFDSSGEATDYTAESASSLYSLLRASAVREQTDKCRDIARVLVSEKGEKPSLQIYHALILSNTHPSFGSAAMVALHLQQMQQDGLQPDANTCHAVLKVVAVHLDHLLRADVLAYMGRRWYSLTTEGMHDVAAGLFREGQLEQGLERLRLMEMEDIKLQGWLLDIAVYALCVANEIEEAYRIMHARRDALEINISRSLWIFLLDKASETRHHAATELVWMRQVQHDYINPSSGILLNILSTAAQASDAALATNAFTRLSKRGTPLRPIHYELLMNTYLSMEPPDLKRALAILTIMPLEKLEPTSRETRSLFTLFTAEPALIPETLAILRELHNQGRQIPIAALNLLIECHIHHSDFSAALQLYKQIHTFAPLNPPHAGGDPYVTIETFNLLLRGCRTGPAGAETEHADFLVNELLALCIRPTALTYDRLIIAYLDGSERALSEEGEGAPETAPPSSDGPPRSEILLDWAYRHFTEMLPMGWAPRPGTMNYLAKVLAQRGDERCWDVVDKADEAREKGHVRMPVMRDMVMEAWSKGMVDRGEGEEGPIEVANGVEGEDIAGGSSLRRVADG